MALVIVFGFINKPSETIKYEYMQLISHRDFINISTPNDWSRVSVKENAKDVYDFSPLLKLVDEYQKAGWEIVNNNITYKDTYAPVNFVLLRKPRD